nr:PREDICTED: peptidyl-alpha-hydroxyglycine alpha-amidating lyase 2-like [Bemisia tabaci]
MCPASFRVFVFLTGIIGCLSTIPENEVVVSEVEDWPAEPIPKLGLVSGVAVNSRQQPIIFHRGPRKIKPYDSKLYNETGHFLLSHEGPIMEDTVLTLESGSGAVLRSWGKGLFYFPHGIAVDSHDNVWLTDIALHQVMKFAENSTTPKLILGEKFSPGSELHQFCKPTAVAISKDGNVFIADGYCNNRILKFDAKGNYVSQFPTQDTAPKGFHLNTPHSLAFIREEELLCVADRENHRILCVNMNPLHASETLKSITSVEKQVLGSPWAIASRGDLLLTVNGSLPYTATSGFIVDPITTQVISRWNPKSSSFRYAHDIAVSPDGNFMYVAEVGPSKIWKFEIKQIN